MRECWKKELLKDASKVFADGDWIETKDQSPEGIRLVQTGNIGFGFFKDKKDKARYVSEETFKRLNCTEIIPGDLLVSRLPDPVGKSCIIPDINTKMITGVDCTIIRPKEYLSSELLGYYQRSNRYLKDVEARVTGTTRSRISRKNLGLIEIPIPPLPEQQQIVALLDQAFAVIDQAKANIEKNIENAKELFQSKLNDIFSQKGEGWEEKSFQDLSSRIGDGLHGTPEYDENGDYFFINGNNLNNGEIEIKVNTKRVNESEYLKHKRELNSNTVLVSINGTLGYVAFYNNEPVILGKSACYINFNKEVNKHYIKYLIKSPLFFDNMASMSTGATIKNFSLKSMRNYKLHLPPFAVQESIVKDLEQLENNILKLESQYLHKFEDVEELKKSILQKAFAGELTNQPVEI